MIRKIVAYTVETRHDTAVTEEITKTDGIRTLKGILYRTQSNEITGLCNIPEVVGWSRQAITEWKPNVMRVSDRVIAKTIRYRESSIGNLRGRPRKRRKDSSE